MSGSSASFRTRRASKHARITVDETRGPRRVNKEWGEGEARVYPSRKEDATPMDRRGIEPPSPSENEPFDRYDGSN